MRSLPYLFALVLTAGVLIASLWLALQLSDSDYVVATVGAVVAIVSASLQYRAAKEKEVEARLFVQKEKVYTDLIDTIMGVFNQKGAEQSEQEQADLVQNLQKLRTKLLIWGSFQTVHTIDEMSALAAVDGRSPLDAAAMGTKWLSKLLQSVRSDLGHNDPDNAPLEMALGVLTEPDRSNVRKQIEKKD